MNFQEKKKSYGRLRGASHFEADRELLKKLAPSHRLLNKTVFRRSEFAGEILYALLESVPEEEIVKHRREYLAAQGEPIQDNANPEPKPELTRSDVLSLLGESNYLPTNAIVIFDDGQAYQLTENGFVDHAFQVIESTSEETASGTESTGNIIAEAEKTILDAEQQAEQIIDEAETEATEIVSDAEEKAEEIVEEAEQQAEEIIEEAEAEKKSSSPHKQAAPRGSRKTNTPA